MVAIPKDDITGGFLTYAAVLSAGSMLCHAQASSAKNSSAAVETLSVAECPLVSPKGYQSLTPAVDDWEGLV